MYRIGIAQTEEELRQVLNLRFRVFTEEQGRNSLADFNAKTYGDDSDVLGQPIFCGYSGGELVATLRLTPRGTETFWNEYEYELDRLHHVHGWAEAVPLTRIGRVDRGVVLPEFRRSQIFKRLFQELLQFAWSSNLVALVGVIDATNQRLCLAYEKHGWITYRSRVPFRDLIANFITLDLSTL